MRRDLLDFPAVVVPFIEELRMKQRRILFRWAYHGQPEGDRSPLIPNSRALLSRLISFLSIPPPRICSGHHADRVDQRWVEKTFRETGLQTFHRRMDFLAPGQPAFRIGVYDIDPAACQSLIYYSEFAPGHTLYGAPFPGCCRISHATLNRISYSRTLPYVFFPHTIQLILRITVRTVTLSGNILRTVLR